MFVEEFLYRGREDNTSIWHVILAEYLTGADEKRKFVTYGPLTPEQSEAMGFPLATIIAEINATAMIERDKAVEEKIKYEAERDQAIVEKTIVEADRDRLQSELDAKETIDAR
jgi:hypothetical protein